MVVKGCLFYVCNSLQRAESNREHLTCVNIFFIILVFAQTKHRVPKQRIAAPHSGVFKPHAVFRIHTDIFKHIAIIG